MSGEAPRYFSRRELRDYLATHAIALKKRWGQNFLCDPNVLRNLVSLVDPRHRHVWEIGPGLGVLTDALLQRGYRVTAFEIDWGLVRALERLFEGEQALRIVPGDVLETWHAAWQKDPPEAVIGNLPYRSSQAILGRLVESGAVPSQLIATLQSEVAERALARSGSSAYSSFTVLLQSRCSVTRHFDVSGDCFFPRPDVSSTVIELTPRDDVPSSRTMSGYGPFVQSCFLARRKTILNNMKRHPALSARPDKELTMLLKRSGIAPGTRPEGIAPDQYYALFRELKRSRMTF